jgi:hypothetical protein
MRALVVPFILLGTSIVAAQPAPEPVESPPSEPPPEPPPPPPETVPTAPPSALPPITITITNNNTGNNNNTNTATNTAPVTVSTPVTTTVTAPVTIAPPALPPLVRPEIAGPGDPSWTPGGVQLVVRRDVPQRWLLVGALGGHDGGGMRASFDLFARRRLAVGIAASATGEHDPHGDAHDARGSAGVVGYLAWTRPLGRIQMRAQFGLGFGATGHHDDQRDATPIARTVGGTTPDDPQDAHPQLGPRAEAALLFALPLGRHFGLVAGPVITATGAGHHEHDGDAPSVDTSRDGHHHGSDAVDCGVFAGLVWRR